MKVSLAVSMLILMTIPAAAETTQSPHGRLKWECYDCHNTISWRSIKQPLNFKHEKTGFPLLGEHANVTCLACHKNLKFAMIGAACADCHTDIHRAQFGSDCDRCHSPKNWGNNQDITSLHASRGFPLVGVHEIADCSACHVGQQQSEYSGTPMDCQGCHADNFASTTDPNHIQAGFNADCQGCHQPVASSWKITTYQHTPAFFLHGKHASIDCNSCHAQGYSNTSSDCYNCHQADFNATTNPAHVTFGFPTTCTACHGDISWSATQFDHLQVSQFALNGAHATILCTACHIDNQLTNLPRDCYGCHQNDFTRVSNPDHVGGNFPQTCLLCHNEDVWSPAIFDHSQSRFPLTGAHTSLQCQACHANGYQNTPFDCYSCHESSFNGAANPNHAQNNFDHNCLVCHTTAAWQPATFDHATTRFPLTGAHVSLQCIACHAGGYQNTPYDCYSCHASDYNNVTDPNHAANNFSHDCTQCHSTARWEGDFNHSNLGFELTGAHATIQCIACHADGYQNTPSDCYSCHQSDFNGAMDPNHVQNNFDHDCSICHSTTAWNPATFDHNNTQFPLTGAHVSVQCQACHAGGYQNTPTDCYSCHQSAFEGVSDPNHVQNNFDHDCTQCHTTAGWTPATFDHANTRFPLTGAHVSLQCIACHSNGYQNTPYDCYSCHQADYEGVTDPDHVADNFSHDCTECHNTSRWDDGTFDHSGTRFPLTGAHIGLQCIACHADGYQNTPYDCYSCHQSDFNGASNPDHAQNNFDHDCTICHSTSVWQPSTFDHNNTNFPLTGAHIPLQCIACHANGYQNTPNDCYSCHQADYERVTDPNHVANNFSHDCTECHNTSSWDDGTFDHSGTRFPLTGAHVGLQCIACHADGYQNTPYDCYSCHQANYDDIADPNHAQDNFGHDCTQCHNTSDWTQVTFDHNITPFPLTGAHLTTPCQSCHAGGYDNIPSDCYSCHQADYDNATNPNHQSAGFPTECQNCHDTNAWVPSTWDHDTQYFPIYSGNHRGRWSTCADCHTNPNDFTVFECIYCHEHNQQDTDSHHQGVPGYQYNSQACYNCHPRGGGGGLLQHK
jgi:hypothetical protein